MSDFLQSYDTFSIKPIHHWSIIYANIRQLLLISILTFERKDKVGLVHLLKKITIFIKTLSNQNLILLGPFANQINDLFDL